MQNVKAYLITFGKIYAKVILPLFLFKEKLLFCYKLFNKINFKTKYTTLVLIKYIKYIYRSRSDFHVARLDYFHYDERIANCNNDKGYDETAEKEEEYEPPESAVLRVCAGIVLWNGIYKFGKWNFRYICDFTIS